MSTTEELYTKAERKINGVFYTPKFLAEYLSDKIIQYQENIKENVYVLDPACGDSELLLNFTKKYVDIRGTYPKIAGVDKDINAIISSKNRFGESIYSKAERIFFNTDSLFPYNKNKTASSWQTIRNEANCKLGFDIILSNPPWGASLAEYNQKKLSENFTLATGQFDIYGLFIEIILSNLSKGGSYGLILPDSLFNQEQANLREILSKKTTINLIARLGEKIFPEINRACVVIIGKNNIAPKNHEVDCFRLSSDYKKKVLSNELILQDVERQVLHKVPQSRFLENNNFLFDIDLQVHEEETLNKIADTPLTLRDVVTNTRGVELSKKGKVCQCSICNYWMPFPKSENPTCKHCNSNLKLKDLKVERIVTNKKGSDKMKLKAGEDLYRYTSVSKSWIDTSRQGINYKDLNIYYGKKILVRKTGVGITASIDYENSLTNQVVYILKENSFLFPKLPLEFILSILNSRAMTYYLIKKYGENEWRSHPYITQGMLLSLPFPMVDLQSQESTLLMDRVVDIVKNEVINSQEKNISISNDIEIEKIVAHFFKLNVSDYKAIYSTLSAAEPLIPIKRLLECNYNEFFV